MCLYIHYDKFNLCCNIVRTVHHVLHLSGGALHSFCTHMAVLAATRFGHLQQASIQPECSAWQFADKRGGGDHLSFVRISCIVTTGTPTYLCLSDWYQPIHKTNFRTSIRSLRAARRPPCIATSRTRFINPIYKRPSVRRFYTLAWHLFCTLAWHLFRIPIRLSPPTERSPNVHATLNIQTLNKVPFIFPIYISEERVLSWSEMNCVYWNYVNL